MRSREALINVDKASPGLLVVTYDPILKLQMSCPGLYEALRWSPSRRMAAAVLTSTELPRSVFRDEEIVLNDPPWYKPSPSLGVL